MCLYAKTGGGWNGEYRRNKHALQQRRYMDGLKIGRVTVKFATAPRGKVDAPSVSATVQSPRHRSKEDDRMTSSHIFLRKPELALRAALNLSQIHQFVAIFISPYLIISETELKLFNTAV